jgi:hypothetical protein
VQLAQYDYDLGARFCSFKYEILFMSEFLSPDELKTEMCAIKFHVQNKIRLQCSDVSAFDLAINNYNSEVHL